ncbi:uncharacterized protein Z518_02858 [Rhinocladiella mackenziei CBS 650.93]|uniref:Rhinocladiella mackenziei CBS 650.93 unplaced genomic scaffold supercont1.2, whole genome shotgun sequence n=1 Tax=Rhinocladiella mackenziei CBS 650.93 TaxID=1442369 RepID=A0A0D2G0Z1_9EURO|nr:uncharacterized protein Z518_02858 [Rhinocladiella mackenziei CBS 650.93]KIX08202.1 hypothetical protein Z518_02858 [Rhinocladiella mackenziei CBS 650.93]
MSGPPYNNLKYYTTTTPNGLKGAIVLEELSLTYDHQLIDITKSAQKEPWFIEINPNGRVPALTDGDLKVFESGAIMLYLTDMYDLDNTISYKYGTPEYYEMVSWLMFQMGGIGPMQGQCHHFRVMAPVHSSYGIKRYTDETNRLYGVLESRLSQADWLAGDKYTIADIASYCWIRVSPLVLDFDLSEWPSVEKWVQKIDARPAVARAKKIPASPRTEEELKVFFRSMRDRLDAMKSSEKANS